MQIFRRVETHLFLLLMRSFISSSMDIGPLPTGREEEVAALGAAELLIKQESDESKVNKTFSLGTSLQMTKKSKVTMATISVKISLSHTVTQGSSQS